VTHTRSPTPTGGEFTGLEETICAALPGSPGKQAFYAMFNSCLGWINMLGGDVPDG
jgi:hypothetical protein